MKEGAAHADSDSDGEGDKKKDDDGFGFSRSVPYSIRWKRSTGVDGKKGKVVGCVGGKWRCS